MLARHRSLLRKIGRDFVYAAENQKFFDEIYYHLFNTSPEEFNALPRPAKWMNRNATLVRTIKALSKPAALLWSHLLFYVYIGLKLTITLLKRGTPPFFNKRNTSTVSFGICDKSYESITKAYSDHSSFVWLIPNNVKLSPKPKNAVTTTQLTPSKILSPYDIVLAAREAIRVHAGLVKVHGAGLGLQSYVLGDWMLMAAATVSLSPEKLVIAEHHDRWAVLADLYCSHKTLMDEGTCTIELVQHGKEHRATYNTQNTPPKKRLLPYRIKNVSVLHVFNRNQESIFKENILDANEPSTTNTPHTKYISNNIELTQYPDERRKVLFIGHPICEDFQQKLYLRLADTKREFIYLYKPHPTAPPGNNVKKLAWQLITEHNLFPNVDLVIAYPSTLADDYEANGIRVLTHPLESKNEEIAHFAREAGKILDSKHPYNDIASIILGANTSQAQQADQLIYSTTNPTTRPSPSSQSAAK